jgi:hypothetical protein
MAGFIVISDVGRERHCSLNRKGFDQLQEWINYYEQFWSSKLKNLEDLMNKERKK